MQGIHAVERLPRIQQAVVVGVGVRGIGATDQFGPIRYAVVIGVRILPVAFAGIGQAIPVSVFKEISQPISVGVTRALVTKRHIMKPDVHLGARFLGLAGLRRVVPQSRRAGRPTTGVDETWRRARVPAPAPRVGGVVQERHRHGAAARGRQLPRAVAISVVAVGPALKVLPQARGVEEVVARWFDTARGPRAASARGRPGRVAPDEVSSLHGRLLALTRQPELSWGQHFGSARAARLQCRAPCAADAPPARGSAARIVPDPRAIASAGADSVTTPAATRSAALRTPTLQEREREPEEAGFAVS